MPASQSPVDALESYLAGQGEPAGIVIAYSGGLDSHVLLHAAVTLLGDVDTQTLSAIHIDHGLHPDSGEWALHCQSVCESMGVPLTTRRVEVADAGDGLEAGARIARYAAFAEVLGEDEQILLAQHADDQAETFLLQALRGSGPDGLASIPRKRTFASGYMARPLLGCSQLSLKHYAEQWDLHWIDDPSNADMRFDRNFLRHQVMPLLRQRWPAAAQTLARAATRSAAASQTLLSLAQEDLHRVRVRGAGELSVSELRNLPRERVYNVLRLWARQGGMRMPRLQDLAQVWTDLLQARSDSVGIVNVRDYEFRRHRDRLYLLPPTAETDAFRHDWAPPHADLLIPETGQLLTLDACRDQGIDVPADATVEVRSRGGGELIKLGEPAFHKAVKKLLQESGVPPWRRDAIPLLYVNGRLAAVWNVAVAVDFRRRELDAELA